MKKFLSAVLLIFLIVNISLTVFAQTDINNIKAKVIINNGVEEIEEEKLPTKKVQKVTVRILEGEYENEEYDMSYVITEDINAIISNTELTEDDNLLVKLEEKEGEVIAVSYVRTINQNNILYLALAISVVLIFIILNKNAVKPFIIYILAIILISYSLILSIQNGWNLIVVSSIISLLITTIVTIKVNGINKRTIGLIVCGLLCIMISYIIMSLIFDFMNITNINIKILESFVNIKELLCSANILLGAGLTNIIIVIVLNVYNSINKPYKTKSDNIIEGQRSLKL